MKSFRIACVLTALALFGVVGSARPARADVTINFNSYAAVAFSSSTGKYGYAYNYNTRGSAERAAIANCGEADAKAVGWVKGGWLALAVGDNKTYGVGWEYGNGAVNVDAKRSAVQECKDRKGKVTVIICVCSGDIEPEIIKQK